MTLALALMVAWLLGLCGFLLGLWWASRAVDKAYLDGVRYGTEALADALTGPEKPSNGLRLVPEGNHPRDELAALRERREKADLN